MLDFLKKEGIHPHLIQELEQFRSAGTEPEVSKPDPHSKISIIMVLKSGKRHYPHFYAENTSC